MPVVKPGQIKPPLKLLPVKGSSKRGCVKRDLCANFLRRCPNATDAEASKICVYNLKAVRELRARILDGSN